jgi:hypothetical protein
MYDAVLAIEDVTEYVDHDEVPNKLPVIPPVTVSGPLMKTEPVKRCVSSTEFPKRVEPLLNDCVT